MDLIRTMTRLAADELAVAKASSAEGRSEAEREAQKIQQRSADLLILEELLTA